MKWFLAKIVFRIVCGNGEHAAQFDEQLRLVTAASEEEAFAKARAFGLAGEDYFENDRHQLVCWQFVNVAELYPLHDPIDGAEVCGRIHEMDDAESYIDFVNRKATLLRSRATSTLQLIPSA